MPCDQRQKGPSSRAHSAINDEAGSSIPRDRHHLLDIFSRPSTTHTYRVRCSSSSHNPAYTHGILFKDQRWYVWPISIFPVGHSVPSFLHSVGQHWAGAARQSFCGHRSEIQLDQLKKKHANAAGKWTGCTGVVVRLIPNWICNWTALAFTETHTCLVLLYFLPFMYCAYPVPVYDFCSTSINHLWINSFQQTLLESVWLALVLASAAHLSWNRSPTTPWGTRPSKTKKSLTHRPLSQVSRLMQLMKLFQTQFSGKLWMKM